MKRFELFEAFQFQALGTDALICAPGAGLVLERARWLVEDYESRFSRFRRDSEVERLSARAGQDVAVSEELFELLELAADFWRETVGVFDPLIRRDLEAAGYDRSFERVPPSAVEPPPTPMERRPTFGDVALDHGSRVARLPEGSMLDLGGIAKGWIVDRLACAFDPQRPFLIDIGGDIVAHGDGPDGEPGWLLAVAEPDGTDGDRCQVRLDGGAVATSTTLRRRWRRGGSWQHHLIDPRTGRPARSDLTQVTVIAQTAVQADVYAKTALMLGRERGLEWVTARGLAALLIGPDETTRTAAWHLIEVAAAAV